MHISTWKILKYEFGNNKKENIKILLSQKVFKTWFCKHLEAMNWCILNDNVYLVLAANNRMNIKECAKKEIG